MATILTKKKDTTGAPSAGDLTNSTGGAELAVNTADKRLYTKNSSNAVVEVGTNPGEAVTFVAGSASTPAITTTGDTNTGIFFPAADTIAFAEGGVEAMRIDSSGNVGIGTSSPTNLSGFTALTLNSAGANNALFELAKGGTIYGRFTGSTAGTTIAAGGVLSFSTGASIGSEAERMRIDSSGNVGIGTTSPNQLLEIAKEGPVLRITDTDTTATSGQDLGQLQFYTNDADGAHIGASLICYSDDSLGRVNGLKFSVSQSNFADATEAMRITSSGNLLVGTTSSNGRITGQSSTSDSSSFALGTKNSSSTDLFRVRGDGALYLGLAGSSPYNLTTGSAANAYLETNGYLYRSTSSRKYKTQIEDIDASRSQAILNFRPVWYRSLCKDDNKSWSYYGLIAEEVAEIEPRLVFWGYNENDYEEVTTETPVERERTVTDENGNETIETYTEVETKTERKLKEDAQLAPEGVQYERLTVFLLDVVKRQDASIKALEARIAALEQA